MVLPIVAFGSDVLRKKCKEINSDYPDLNLLIENMWQTMYESSGVGLAAPQINKDIRIFLIDTKTFMEEGDEENSIKKVFINPTILEESGENWNFNEGCLSIPDIREDVYRKETIQVSYLDQDFKPHKKTLSGLAARVFQHEYDHIEGVLFWWCRFSKSLRWVLYLWCLLLAVFW